MKDDKLYSEWEYEYDHAHTMMDFNAWKAVREIIDDIWGESEPEKCNVCGSEEELEHIFNVNKSENIVCRQCWKDSGFDV